MSVYTKVLRLLLEESEKINVPDEAMLGVGFVMTNDEGFKYTIKKIAKDEKGKRKFLIVSDGYKEVLTYDQIKKNFKRA